MNVLLFHPHVESLEMIRFCLESQMSLTVRETSSIQGALDILLGEEPIELIVSSLELGSDKLFKYLLSTGATIPLILIGEDPSQRLQTYPDLQILARLPATEVPGQLIKLIRQNFDTILQSNSQNEYCRIHPELLMRTTPLKSDIYIRLSNVKYVKLFKTGASFTQQDLEKYLLKKKVSYLYIKTNETQEFVGKFTNDLTRLVATASSGEKVLLETASQVHVLIRELTDRLGFDPAVQELARQHIQLTIKGLGQSPQLTSALSHSQLKELNYISSHSVLLANIACSLATMMKWPSDITFKKLVLAALFHDFTFQDPDLAKISTRKELEKARSTLTQEQYEAVASHPLKCLDLIKDLKDMPGEVDFLILEHHERPDGSGFPSGLNAMQITPLSSLFIVAHDLLDHMVLEGSKFSLKAFLYDTEPLYRNGTFKQIWKTLSQQALAVEKENKDSVA